MENRPNNNIKVIRISQETANRVIWDNLMEMGDYYFECKATDDDTEEAPILTFNMIQDAETCDYIFALADLYLKIDFDQLIEAVPITAKSLSDFSKKRIYIDIMHQGSNIQVIRISEEAAKEVLLKNLMEMGTYYFDREPLDCNTEEKLNLDEKAYSMIQDDETGDYIFVLADRYLEIDFDKIIKTVPITTESLYNISGKQIYITLQQS